MRKSLIYLNIIIIISSFLFSQNLGSMLNKANNKLKAGELKQVETMLQKILDIDPSYAPARVAYSKIWLQRADISKANEYATLAVRIDDAKPKVIVSASCGIEGNKIIEYKPLLDEAIELSRRFGGKDSAGFVNGVLDQILHRKIED